MSLVDSFTHLKGRPEAELALPLLQRIASLVKPVMRKHGWRLPVLGEFFPDELSLLGQNMNFGQKILLRLRPPWLPDTFYDEEQLVSVMLHELTHNVHGPHDDKFYKYLSDLEAEYDALRRGGYDGEGFYSAGKRLGVGVSHNLPPHFARARALQAAEKRRTQQVLLGSPGGQRLGGRHLVGSAVTSPRELAVQAAERRARDEKSCGTSKGSAQVEAEKAARDSAIDKADIPGTVQYESDTSKAGGSTGLSADGMLSGKSGWSCTVCTLDNLPSALHCLVCLSVRPREGRQSYGGKQAICSSPSHNTLAPNSSTIPESSSASSEVLGQMSIDAGWSCSACTFFNPDHTLQCSVCTTLRPKSVPKDGWTCSMCGEDGMPHEFWSCRFCGSIKESSSSA